MSPSIARHTGPDLATRAGHDLVALTGRVRLEMIVGYLACATCSVILRLLRVCGEPTKAGTPCRVPIREDLGYTSCWSHGEGKGRTSTPRKRPPARWGAAWQVAGTSALSAVICRVATRLGNPSHQG